MWQLQCNGRMNNEEPLYLREVAERSTDGCTSNRRLLSLLNPFWTFAGCLWFVLIEIGVAVPIQGQHWCSQKLLTPSRPVVESYTEEHERAPDRAPGSGSQQVLPVHREWMLRASKRCQPPVRSKCAMYTLESHRSTEIKHQFFLFKVRWITGIECMHWINCRTSCCTVGKYKY